MLFKGKHLGGKLTRTLTKSHVDHVALILKFKNPESDDVKDEVYLFESIGNTGVSLNKWEDLRINIGTTGSFYSECIYRKVEFERARENL